MISIIIPTWNRREMLFDAIKSIMEQSYKDVEIVIVNDASNDDTEDYIFKLNSPKIKYIKNDKNMFAHNSRRIGYKKCSGDFVIFMDDDDYYIDRNFFQNVVDIFENKSNISTVIGSTVSIKNGVTGSSIDIGFEGEINQVDYINGFSTKYNKPSSTLSAVFRKSMLDKINFEDFIMINDTCIYLNGILCGDVYLMNKPVAAYRIHSSNISKSRFKKDFIRGTLDGKVDIYKKAREKNLLKDPKLWLANQLEVSAFYFIFSSGKDISTFLLIVYWYLINGQGTLLLFLNSVFKKL